MGGPARAKLSVRRSMFTYSPSLVPSIKDKYLSSTPLSLVPEGLAPEGRGVGRSTPLKPPKRLVKPQRASVSNPLPLPSSLPLLLPLAWAVRVCRRELLSKIAKKIVHLHHAPALSISYSCSTRSSTGERTHREGGAAL